MPTIGSFYSKTYTATDDVIFRVEDERIILKSTNIHCYTADAYIGNTYLQPGIIRANAVIWFEGDVDISDIWFRNFAAGANTTIVIEGIISKG